MERHKWVTDDLGNKTCSKCNSQIKKASSGFRMFWETDKFGCLEPANWYPRCQPPKQSILDLEKTDKV